MLCNGEENKNTANLCRATEVASQGIIKPWKKKEGGGEIKGSGVFPNPTDTFIKPSDLRACNSQTTTQERLESSPCCILPSKSKQDQQRSRKAIPQRHEVWGVSPQRPSRSHRCLLWSERNPQENRKVTLLEGRKGLRVNTWRGSEFSQTQSHTGGSK